MRKTMIVLGCMSLGLAHAQQDYEKRVGINTSTPRASLEVKAVDFNGITQGILFPHIDEDEKARWTQSEDKGLVAGTVIWNTTKLCLDYFDGTNWQCTDGTKANVHPTKWTPVATTYTGTAIWGDEAGEVLRVAKNTCPTGQKGVYFNYPVNNAQHITYTATSTVSQEDADQKALMEMENSNGIHYILAQDYANKNGACEVDYGGLLPSCFDNVTGTYGVIQQVGEKDIKFVGEITSPLDQQSKNLLDGLASGEYAVGSHESTTIAGAFRPYTMIDLDTQEAFPFYGDASWAFMAERLTTAEYAYLGGRTVQLTHRPHNADHRLRVESKCFKSFTKK